MSNQLFLFFVKKIYSIYRDYQKFTHLKKMSLFEEFQTWEIIQNPKATYSYRRTLAERKETMEEREARERAERKALSKKMKEEMSPEEFKKRRQKELYKKNRNKVIEKKLKAYHEQREEDLDALEETYVELYWRAEFEPTLDEFYTKKYREDDVKEGRKYQYAWWLTQIRWMNRREIDVYTEPIRICDRKWMDTVLTRLWWNELKAYQALQPYKNKLEECFFSINKRKQMASKYPMWAMDENMREVVKEIWMTESHVCTVADWMKRGKYFQSEVYLWRNSFIIWDVIITQTGHLFRISLNGGPSWLTKETIEDEHEDRMKFFRREIKKPKHLYRVSDAYLIKIDLNERERCFYIVPT